MPIRSGAVLASCDAIGWSRPGLRSTPQCRCYAQTTSDRGLDPVVCIPTGQIFRAMDVSVFSLTAPISVPDISSFGALETLPCQGMGKISMRKNSVG